MSDVSIPNRPVFRAQEVCDLAEVQLYVLRTWEAEFPDLGVAKAPNGPRVYRRADVERVLRLKHLLFNEGLTLAGARRRLSEEGLAPNPEVVEDADLAAMIDGETRQHLRDVRQGLQWILGVLSRDGEPGEFSLEAEPAAPRRGASSKPQAVAKKPVAVAPKSSAKGTVGSKKK